MALTEAQKNENRKDLASGKPPRHATSITAAAGGTIDSSYGAPEAAEITNHTTRQGEIQQALEDAGLLA